MLGSETVNGWLNIILIKETLVVYSNCWSVYMYTVTVVSVGLCICVCEEMVVYSNRGDPPDFHGLCLPPIYCDLQERHGSAGIACRRKRSVCPRAHDIRLRHWESLSPGHTFTYAATDREGWSRIEKSRMKRGARPRLWRESMFPRWEYGREGQSECLIRFHGSKIRETQGCTMVRRGATVNSHGTATEDDGATTDTHGSKRC